jgi:hypothetical protein
MDDLSNQFQSLLNSPLGKELIKSLQEDLHGSLIADAEKAETQEKAYGLLKEAAGVIKAVGHIQFLASQMPSDEGSNI